jgi:hypothetical protein
MRDQGLARDNSLGLLIASGMFEGSCRAGPSEPYLVPRGRSLKLRREIFKPIGDCSDLFGAA